MADLIGLSEEVAGQVFTLQPVKTLIGREGGNHIIVDNGTVSGNHCFIAVHDGVYSIQDLGSTNGITVNDEVVEHRELKPNDIVEVGSIKFRLQVDELVAPPAAITIPPAAPAAPAPSFGAPGAESASDLEDEYDDEDGFDDEAFAEEEPSRTLGAVYLLATLVGVLALGLTTLYYLRLILK